MAEKEEEKDVAATETHSAERPEGMSKNQWKKLIRRKQYEEGRQEWRKRQKEKEKEKRRKRREAGIVREPPLKKQKMSDSTASSVRVALELGYQDLMSVQDIRSLMKQCQRCYSANRRAAAPLQLYFTSFNGRFKEHMEMTVPDHIRWDVHFRSGDYVTEFGVENIVFLAAESPNILTDLAPDKVYVIGGLVDHNHHKGHCYEDALSRGVAHAQLPISEHIALRSRKVLAVNHVFEILVEFVQHRDWKTALQNVIPLRKQANDSINTSQTSTRQTSTPLPSSVPETSSHHPDDVIPLSKQALIPAPQTSQPLSSSMSETTSHHYDDTGSHSQSINPTVSETPPISESNTLRDIHCSSLTHPEDVPTSPSDSVVTTNSSQPQSTTVTLSTPSSSSYNLYQSESQTHYSEIN